jgi:fucose permease
VLGGIVYAALDGATSYQVAIAYGLWVAAAACLVALPFAGSRQVYKRTNLPLIESWVLITAAVVLSVAGAIVDLP